MDPAFTPPGHRLSRLPRRPPLVSAFFGCSGRTDATHAALILADTHAALGQAVALVRIVFPGEVTLPPPRIRPEGITVTEHVASTAGEADAVVAGVVAATASGDHVVLDLPAPCLADAALRRRIDVPVMAVGPAPLDEHAAACILADDAEGSPGGPAAGEVARAPVWLLGCGRGGGAGAAAAFARAMEQLAVGADWRPRVLPSVLPSLSRLDAGRLAEGDRTARTFAAGLPLRAALRIVARDPHAEAVDPQAYAAGLAEEFASARQPDQREAPDRLYGLADELQGIRDGAAPTAADLADAPRLEDWRHATRDVRILTGRVYGHPDIPDGRRITTSDLYATDRAATWARTISRYYRLGSPAPGRRPA